MLILILILAIATTIALLRTIPADGYGSRPAPPSHHRDLTRPLL